MCYEELCFHHPGLRLSVLGGSGTQCCVHRHFGAFFLRTGADVGVGQAGQEQGWPQLGWRAP